MGSYKRIFEPWLPELGGLDSLLEGYSSTLLGRKPRDVGEGGWCRRAHQPVVGGQSLFMHIFPALLLTMPAFTLRGVPIFF